ncbi:PucR family transcriptional regulator ligand-binding domain-containing protein [Alkalihalobacillus sp. BA299]|uniref:PucR family transcriptional regulator n=1 Tax=Alkalihalobacillus sp. BA299 TaxID=2815938 RepID=UPI001AD9E31D|nr:PucR family transcriptional regulator [Alkalihalobacillus sp. BA299]
MQLKEILALPTFKEAKVVAGHEGLNKSVQSINLMDAPDIIHYLKRDQLLLTTAYSVRNNPNALNELVKQMAKQDCAGLGLKTKRYIDEIPENLIEVANKFNFPIIELPLHHSLGEMLNEGLSYILKERTEELNYALNIHREFTNIIMSGGGFSQVIKSLGSILNTSILLLNYRLEIMSSSHPIDKEEFFDVYWNIYELISNEQFDNYKVLTIPLEGTTIDYEQFSIYPIYTTNQQKGYVVILGSALNEQTSFQLAVEQAANVLSFEFMKMHAVEQQARRVKNEFFTDLVEGTIASEQEIINRGKIYSLDKSRQYICLTCKIDGASDYYLDHHPLQAEKDMNNKRDHIYDVLEVVLAKKFEQSVVFTKGDVFAILIGFDFYNDSVEKEVYDSILQTQLDVHIASDISLSFGISNYVENVKDIPTTFQEAVDALRLGYRENKERFIKTYRTKDLTELLKSIPTQKLKEFYKSTLKDLAFSSEKEKIDLVQTLEFFLNHNCQISETAKSMYIHRNTVIYRLKKCEEILGRDIKNSDETLRLRMALFVKTLLPQ